MSATAAPASRGSESQKIRLHPLREAAGSLPGRGTPAAESQWHAIEVRHLVALAAVARERSFRGAADSLGYVQSAISGQIARLERAVGTRLLERASGTPLVELTNAGELLLRHTHEILARFDTAYTDVNSVANRKPSVVRVAGLEHLPPRHVARILSLFRSSQPFARVMIEEDCADANEGSVHPTADMLISVAVAGQLAPGDVWIGEDDHVLLVPASSAFSACGQVSRTELTSVRPMLPRSCALPGVYQQLCELGVECHAAVIPDTVSTAVSLVASGLGAAIVPSRFVEPTVGALAALPLGHVLQPQVLALSLHPRAAQSQTIGAFVQAIHQVLQEERMRRDGALWPLSDHAESPASQTA
jgi:DNA-binding transcriptional LysR family regulator